MGLLSFWLLLSSVLLQTAELQQKAENCKVASQGSEAGA
jgi:hypothetical protein